MKSNFRAWLLASASSIALAGTAIAADMPIVNPIAKGAYVTPVQHWNNWYVGLNAGVAAHSWDWNDTSISFGGSNSIWSGSRTGFTIGGQIGRDWQQGSFVYGVAADLNWYGVKDSTNFMPVTVAPDVMRGETKINWLSTFRVRAGIAASASPTLFYLTTGLAVGSVRNGWSDTGYWDGNARSVGGNKTRVGFTGGVGIEHYFGQNWTGFLEARYTNLGRSKANWTSGGDSYTSEFSNSLIEVRGGINLRY